MQSQLTLNDWVIMAMDAAELAIVSIQQCYAMTEKDCPKCDMTSYITTMNTRIDIMTTSTAFI